VVANKFLEKNLDALTEELTNLTRETAATMGWSKDVIDKVSVSWDENGIDEEFPESIASQVDDFEYGSANNTLMPALRVSQNNSQDLVEKYVAKAIEESFMNSEAFK
jgi:hypothetical protein